MTSDEGADAVWDGSCKYNISLCTFQSVPWIYTTLAEWVVCSYFCEDCSWGIFELWSKAWDLALSIQIANFLQLGKYNTNRDYYIEGARLQVVNEFKDLGFNLNNVLMCKGIAARADRRLFLLFKTLPSKYSRLLVRAYKVFVRCLLKYGTYAYSSY